MLTLDEYIATLKNKSIAVIGAGVSNRPLIEKLLEGGCHVTVRDARERAALEPEAERWRALGAELRLGEDYLEGLNEELIFRTPGLMPFEEHLEAARRRGSVLSSEMEVFFSLCPCKIIAVTGSDGKTTTSTVISELLKAAGYHVHLGGNIGKPLLCETPEMKPEDVAVLELSSFQLHSMSCHPQVAVVTNISPNHLDKHKDYQDYIDAKRQILLQQTGDDLLVLNAEDPLTDYLASFSSARISCFSDCSPLQNGAVAESGVVYRVSDGIKRPILPVDEILLPGEHNVLNYLAAFSAVEGLVPDEVCAEVARSFQGVEHRLERVRVLDGVTFINDSIGTSPSRTIAGLKAMKTRPIVILGGYDKHIPFEPLGDELCRRAKEVVITGATAEKIEKAILSSGLYPACGLKLHRVDDFHEAVLTAWKLSGPGDVVLLSPACAAFDRFENFAVRGRVFKDIVRGLKSNEDR